MSKIPHSNTQGRDAAAVKDVPPANPFGEPVKAPGAYPDGDGAEITQATLKPGETIVEHPLSPTDTNPNPHGQREQPFVSTVVKGEDGPEISAPQEGPVEIEGTSDHPDGTHLGDGRSIRKGERLKVTEEIAKAATDGKWGKRV